MRILKLGVDPRPKLEPPWWFDMELECHKCRTVFVVENTDHVSRCATYDPVTFAHVQAAIIPSIKITCPVCQESVGVERPAATTTLAKYNANPTECRQSDTQPG